MELNEKLEQIKIEDIVIVLGGVEKAIKEKIFNNEEITKIFNSWNNLTSTLERYNRQVFVNNIYKKDDKKESSFLNEEIKNNINM